MRYAWRSGRTGTTSRPKVKLVTPANEAYHAASAVASPNQPNSLLIPELPGASQIPSKTNVIHNSRNRLDAREAIELGGCRRLLPIDGLPATDPGR